MKWIIQFLIGESRLLELWDRAADNPVVQLFDPAHRGKLAKFVYTWLSVLLPLACFALVFMPLLIPGGGSARSLLAAAFGFLVACCFIGAVALPVFGMIVLRGRLHEREGLEQLCLTPLTREEIAFGAVYWPIRFSFRTLRLLLSFTWAVGLAFAFSELVRSSSFRRGDDFEVIPALFMGGAAATLIFASAALSSLMVSARIALAFHDGRWRLLYRVPLEMIPHAFWVLGVMFCSMAVTWVFADQLFGGFDDWVELITGGVSGLTTLAILIRFQLSFMMRRVCIEGPSLFFEDIREADEPQPIWGKAEWAVVRTPSTRKQVLAELSDASGFAARAEYFPSVGFAIGVIAQAIVVTHALVLAFPINSYRDPEEWDTLLNRFHWMGLGPMTAFILPTVLWLVWWGVYGRVNPQEGSGPIRRDAPLLSASYGVLRRLPMGWVIPCGLLIVGFIFTSNTVREGEMFVTVSLWSIFVAAGIALSCVVSLQVLVAHKPMRTAMTWLCISFVYILAAGYREAPHGNGRIWVLDEDLFVTSVAGMFLFGTAVVYILPIVGHVARHRGLDALNDDEEEKKIDSLTSSSSSSGLGITE